MKKYFITAKKNISLADLVKENIKNIDADDLISSGACWLDKKRINKKNHIIYAKETIQVFINNKPTSKHSLNSQNIIYEDKNIIVVYKPDKLNVQSDVASQTTNLTFAVQKYLSKKNISYTPTPITRLDLNVSGLVLFAKNKDTEKKLFALSRERKIYKKYTAFLEYKQNIPKRIFVNNKLLFSKNKARENENGKKSKTLFCHEKTVNNFEKYSVFIFTGRRHQIRAHASSYLSPIAGDRKYGAKISGKKLALTATGLNFRINDKKYRIRLQGELIAKPEQNKEEKSNAKPRDNITRQQITS